MAHTGTIPVSMAHNDSHGVPILKPLLCCEKDLALNRTVLVESRVTAGQ